MTDEPGGRTGEWRGAAVMEAGEYWYHWHEQLQLTLFFAIINYFWIGSIGERLTRYKASDCFLADTWTFLESVNIVTL